MSFKKRYKHYNEYILADDQLLEEVLDSLHNKNERPKRKHFPAGIARYVACFICVLSISGSVLAAGYYKKQREISHLNTSDEMQEYAAENQLDSIAVSSELYDSDIFKNASKEYIDRVDSIAVGTLSDGSDQDAWSRKRINGNFSIYDYDTLSHAMTDQSVSINLTNLEKTYQLWNEKGCEVCKNTDGSLNYLLIYGDYIDASGRIITVDYQQYSSSRDNQYLYSEGKNTYSSVTTADGTVVSLEYQKGTAGDHRIIASMYNDYALFDVIFYGNYTKDEVLDILNTMELGKEFHSEE